MSNALFVGPVLLVFGTRGLCEVDTRESGQRLITGFVLGEETRIGSGAISHTYSRYLTLAGKQVGEP